MKNGGGYVAHLEEKTWDELPVLTEPVLFEKLSALPPERIEL